MAVVLSAFATRGNPRQPPHIHPASVDRPAKPWLDPTESPHGKPLSRHPPLTRHKDTSLEAWHAHPDARLRPPGHRSLVLGQHIPRVLRQRTRTLGPARLVPAPAARHANPAWAGGPYRTGTRHPLAGPGRGHLRRGPLQAEATRPSLTEPHGRAETPALVHCSGVAHPHRVFGISNPAPRSITRTIFVMS
jgi:hypothetical protein